MVREVGWKSLGNACYALGGGVPDHGIFVTEGLEEVLKNGLHFLGSIEVVIVIDLLGT